MQHDYDVIVIGGGTTGIPAAVQAARAGARTLLVEKNGLLGGTITVAGVTAPALFWAWGRPIIAGIGWELTQRAVDEAGGTLPDFTVPGPKQNSHSVRVNGPLFAALADQMVLESGCQLLLHTMPAAAEPTDTGWRVTLCTKTGLTTMPCRVLIDATGDANVVRLAGLPVRHLPERQPGTLLFRLGGYDPAGIDVEALQRAFDAECAAGRLRRSDVGWNHGSIAGLVRSRGFNCIHVCDIDGGDSESRTAAEVRAREILLDLYRFLRRQPGFEQLRIESICPECGLRETVVIEGRETVTLDDYWSGRVWDDAVCYSFYPIDLHLEDGLDFRPLPDGVVPTLPRGAMLPRASRHMLAPGRHMASDRLANSALRVQASCMAAGQAAGAMAALSARSGASPEELPMADIRQLLEAHGAIVPPPAREGPPA